MQGPAAPRKVDLKVDHPSPRVNRPAVVSSMGSRTRSTTASSSTRPVPVLLGSVSPSLNGLATGDVGSSAGASTHGLVGEHTPVQCATGRLPSAAEKLGAVRASHQLQHDDGTAERLTPRHQATSNCERRAVRPLTSRGRWLTREGATQAACASREPGRLRSPGACPRRRPRDCPR